MKNKVQDLVDLAYERELNEELSKLYQHLERYRDRQSKFFNINDIKLKFYRETSEDIWRIYHHLAPDQAIQRAVALGFLTTDEIPANLQDLLHARAVHG
jgi:hypothetical protein